MTWCLRHDPLILSKNHPFVILVVKCSLHISTQGVINCLSRYNADYVETTWICVNHIYLRHMNSCIANIIKLSPKNPECLFSRWRLLGGIPCPWKSRCQATYLFFVIPIQLHELSTNVVHWIIARVITVMHPAPTVFLLLGIWYHTAHRLIMKVCLIINARRTWMLRWYVRM